MNKARWGLERSILLPFVGRAAEVPDALVETRQIARLLGHNWILGWACWAEIVAVSFAGDGDRVKQLSDEAMQEGYRLPNVVTQGGMWAEVAQAFARCGRQEDAMECLGRARNTPGLPPQFLEYAEVYVAAHFSEPTVALERVHAFAASGTVEVDKRWTMPLLEGLCLARLGEQDQAREALQRAHEAAALLGQPSLPLFAEGPVVKRITTETLTASASQRGESLVEVSVFGELSLKVNGQDVAVPGGMVSTLLKLLALNGGSAVLDQVIDPMWPDADLELGRRRLRNVVRRVRAACGDILDRSGETIAFAEHVGVDLARAESAAHAAIQGNRTIDAVAEAIRLNDRPLLPGDRYEDWAEDGRRAQSERLVRLYDLQAELAEAAADIDLAVDALEAAQHHSPVGLERVKRAVALLRSVERTAAADALAERHQLHR